MCLNHTHTNRTGFKLIVCELNNLNYINTKQFTGGLKLDPTTAMQIYILMVLCLQLLFSSCVRSIKLKLWSEPLRPGSQYDAGASVALRTSGLTLE